MFNDRDFIACLARGDNEAWTVVNKTFGPLLRGVAKAKGATDPDAAVQEGYIIALRNISKAEVFDLRGYLINSVRYAAGDQVKKHMRRHGDGKPKLQSYNDDVVSPATAEPAMDSESINLLRECLAKLPDPVRSILVGYYFQMITLEMIAQSLGMSESGVCKAKSRGLKTLAKMLKERGHSVDLLAR